MVLVTEHKVVLWLHVLLKRNPQMGQENLLQHIKAVTDLWKDQKSRGLVTTDSPREGAAIKGLIRRHKRGKESRKLASYTDKGARTLADGYSLKDVVHISTYFFRKGRMLAFRSKLDFLLGHSMLCRSGDKRNAYLSNLIIHELENEAPTPCYAVVVLNISKSKTNHC